MESTAPFHLPTHAPVMILPGATLFPHALLPLYIFEPRYRQMLAWVLDKHRMFCVAMMKPGITEATSASDFHHVAGLGLVRACVGHEDGTAHLILHGLARVRLTDFRQEKPFRIAELEEISVLVPDEEEGQMLSARVLACCARQRAAGMVVPDEIDQQLAAVGDPAVLADIIAHTFVQDAERRQEILQEARVAERLRMLLGMLSTNDS
jgi:Lon protease-like protein